jgi:hypothetical protein
MWQQLDIRLQLQAIGLCRHACAAAALLRPQACAALMCPVCYAFCSSTAAVPQLVCLSKALYSIALLGYCTRWHVLLLVVCWLRLSSLLPCMQLTWLGVWNFRLRSSTAHLRIDRYVFQYAAACACFMRHVSCCCCCLVVLCAVAGCRSST